MAEIHLRKEVKRMGWKEEAKQRREAQEARQECAYRKKKKSAASAPGARSHTRKRTEGKRDQGATAPRLA